jgi:hypothetical protein
MLPENIDGWLFKSSQDCCVKFRISGMTSPTIALNQYLIIAKSRDDWIRTSGPYVPNVVRYRAALHPEISIYFQLLIVPTLATVQN